MKVLFAAGGTGGHLFPALEIARELTEEGVDCCFAAHGLSSSPMFPRDIYPWWDISAGRPSLLKAASFCWTTATSAIRTSNLLGTVKPDCVIGFGSFHTFPVLLATWLRRIPLFLFESNVAPGRVIRLFAKYATCTGVCFPEAQKCIGKRSELVSMPLLRAHCGFVSREDALARYGLLNKPVVVAFGGSQGSQVINEAILKALALFSEHERPQLLLLCGLGQDQRALEQKAQKLGSIARIIPFERGMSYVYSAASVVVCRSGASTVAELKMFKKPAICIPYPHAKDNHQLFNATSLEKSGLAKVIEEKDLTAEGLQGSIAEMLQRDFSNVCFDEGRDTFSEVILKHMKG